MRYEQQDHYRVLQVHPAANPLVIKAAYRVLARIFHPDVFGDEDEMKKINAAWEILGDPKARAKYDQDRAAGGPQVANPIVAAPPMSDPFRRYADPSPGPGSTPADHAGPPRGMPFGPILTFGRYEGWSLGQVVRVDREYLEWLRRVPAGRQLYSEIDAVLRSAGIPGVDRRRYDLDRRARHLSGMPSGA